MGGSQVKKIEGSKGKTLTCLGRNEPRGLEKKRVQQIYNLDATDLCLYIWGTKWGIIRAPDHLLLGNSTQELAKRSGEEEKGHWHKHLEEKDNIENQIGKRGRIVRSWQLK